MKKYISMFVALLLVVGMVTIFAACGEKKEETPVTETTTSTETSTTETKTEEPKTEETKEEPKAEEKAEETTQATGDYLATVVFETNYGTYEIGLYKDTPVASNNMIEKAKSGFYNNLTFHRIIQDFMIQGGDPQGTGTGGGNMQMDPKPAGNTNKKGTISMASSSGAPLAHQSDCQFFINTQDNLRLDSDYGFVAFGEVTSGWETIEKIASVPVGQGQEPTPSLPLEKVIITKAYVK